jgi:hypothetical protein
VAIVGVFAAAHGDFVAGVNLRHAPQSSQQREGELEVGDGDAGLERKRTVS